MTLQSEQPDTFGFFRAIHHDDLEQCRAWIKSGVDVNALGPTNDSPLIDAVFFKHEAICRLLLDAGADLSVKGNLGLTPLHRAVQFNAMEIVKLFLAHGANIHARAIYGETVLHSAAAAKMGVELCELLIAHGGKINSMSASGMMPVHYAARYGVERTCRYFTKKGFGSSYLPPGALPTELTPFQAAVESGNIATARYYIEECGEDLGQKTRTGRSLLQLAGKDGKEMKAFLRAMKTGLAIQNSLNDDDAGTVAAKPATKSFASL